MIIKLNEVKRIYTKVSYNKTRHFNKHVLQIYHMIKGMYKASKRLEAIEFNQSPIFSTRSCTRHTKLYGLKETTGSLTCRNFSPIFLLSSSFKVITFGPDEEAIDIFMTDVLIDVSASSSFGGSSCSWSMSSSLASRSFAT